MNPQAAQTYFRSKVLTATPEQLQLMLFDGAIRFSEQGKIALEKKDFEAAHKSLTRAQEVVNELNATLRRDIYPELCARLAALYNYAHRNLVAANIKHEPALAEEALKVIRYQRETWVMLMEKLNKVKAAEATRMEVTPPEMREQATISMEA